MQCSICGAIMYIKNGKYRTEQDTTPDLPTKLFYDQVLECTDKRCKHTEMVSNEIKLEKE